MRGKATLIALCLLALMVPARRAAAVEAVPGDSCTGNPTNSWIWAGAPENGGVVNGMFCNTNWLGVINFQSSGKIGIGTTAPAATLEGIFIMLISIQPRARNNRVPGMC